MQRSPSRFRRFSVVVQLINSNKDEKCFAKFLEAPEPFNDPMRDTPRLNERFSSRLSLKPSLKVFSFRRAVFNESTISRICPHNAQSQGSLIMYVTIQNKKQS